MFIFTYVKAQLYSTWQRSKVRHSSGLVTMRSRMLLLQVTLPVYLGNISFPPPWNKISFRNYLCSVCCDCVIKINLL